MFWKKENLDGFTLAPACRATAQRSNTLYAWNLIAESYNGGLPQAGRNCRLDKPIPAGHGRTKEQGIGKANGNYGVLRMKIQPAYCGPSALAAPRCMAALARLITHVQQSRFKIKNQSMKSKLAPRL